MKKACVTICDGANGSPIAQLRHELGEAWSLWYCDGNETENTGGFWTIYALQEKLKSLREKRECSIYTKGEIIPAYIFRYELIQIE